MPFGSSTGCTTDRATEVRKPAPTRSVRMGRSRVRQMHASGSQLKTSGTKRPIMIQAPKVHPMITGSTHGEAIQQLPTPATTMLSDTTPLGRLPSTHAIPMWPTCALSMVCPATMAPQARRGTSRSGPRATAFREVPIPGAVGGTGPSPIRSFRKPMPSSVWPPILRVRLPQIPALKAGAFASPPEQTRPEED